MRLVLPLLFVTACAPNHVGNPLTLPLRGVANVAQNATYDAQRGRVFAVVSAHQPAIQAEALAGTPGPSLTTLFATARIPAENQPAAIRDLAELSGPTPPSYWYLPQWPPSDWTERATVVAMVHGP